jgi:GT2 family glycosyltransferase
VVEEVGPLDAGYFFFLEETDWCWRMRDAGWRVLHVPDARVLHLSGSSSKGTHPATTRIEFHRSLYRFLRQRRGWPTLAVAVMLRVTRGLLSLVLLAPAAILDRRLRARQIERWQLLLWHLRGCPADQGLAQLPPQQPEDPVDGSARKGEPVAGPDRE